MPSGMKNGIDADAILNQIRQITMIESPTGNRAGVNQIIDIVAGWFAGTGAALERTTIDEQFGDMLCVHCDPTRSEPGILVLSHVDTVHPLGTISGPLPYRRDGDRVFGPGIYDMKGGLTLAAAAFSRLARNGVQRRLPLTFMFTPDEEVGSTASRTYIEREAALNRYVLVTEPKRGGGKVVTQRKGVGRYEVRARGRPAHAGGNHDKGRSAIRALAEIILQIEGFTDYPRGITTNVGLASGGTAVNVIPEHAVAYADLRVRDLAAADELEQQFRQLRCSDPDVEIIVSGGLNRPPYVRDAKIDALFAKAAAIYERIGLRLESDGMSGGGSDGNFTAALGVATLDGLGVAGDGAHTHHEHLLFSSIVPGTLLFQGLFETLE